VHVGEQERPGQLGDPIARHYGRLEPAGRRDLGTAIDLTEALVRGYTTA
jgi:hypothetical protein